MRRRYVYVVSLDATLRCRLYLSFLRSTSLSLSLLTSWRCDGPGWNNVRDRQRWWVYTVTHVGTRGEQKTSTEHRWAGRQAGSMCVLGTCVRPRGCVLSGFPGFWDSRPRLLSSSFPAEPAPSTRPWRLTAPCCLEDRAPSIEPPTPPKHRRLNGFFYVFGGHMCPLLGPLISLFWISDDVSSRF